MMVPSLGNFVYYVLFIDNYSRKTWIYFLKAKDEVFKKFQDFKALVENLSKRKIKFLRFDNGGEYTSRSLKTFLEKQGLRESLQLPTTPSRMGL